MTHPTMGLVMLGLIVIAIMMGFPTAFTLMGLGMLFGFVAYFDPDQTAFANRVFDLMVQRTYGGMTNDTLLSIPLFVLMGYVIERAALVDKMFHAVQLAFRRVPGSLAVATLIVCAFWGMASGIVGAVVVLMGVIAMRPMLNAGYDTRLAAGAITAGGTLGILIPPSVMLIVYAAVAGQSVVKLYAAAIVPGFFLATLYLIYVIGYSTINPKVAPRLPPEALQIGIPKSIRQLAEEFGQNPLLASLRAVFSPGRVSSAARRDVALDASSIDAKADPRFLAPLSYARAWSSLLTALLPAVLVLGILGATWWFVEVRHAATGEVAVPAESGGLAEPEGSGSDSRSSSASAGGLQEPEVSSDGGQEPSESSGVQEPPGSSSGVQEPTGSANAVREPPGALARTAADNTGASLKEPLAAALPSAEQVKSEAVHSNFRRVFWIAAALGLFGLANYYRKFRVENLRVVALLAKSVLPLAVLCTMVLSVILFGVATATESAAVGAASAFILALASGQLTFAKTKEAVFLTAKTTSMVCWLFVGSALFSAVFALHGGQELIERWILGMNLTPLQFLVLSQAIIFILGWPLEWTEIIVIFVPIFLPLLAHFGIDPLIFATLVAVNLQAAFLSPPVAMSAFYLKGVSPPHVTLNQIFAGMMPYMFIVIICMVLLYTFPEMILWLPEFLYGR